jgi:hypothetical protein
MEAVRTTADAKLRASFMEVITQSERNNETTLGMKIRPVFAAC